jgi:integrase
MSIRRVKLHGHWRYQARVAVQGARLSRVCLTRAAARHAEADLLQTLTQRAAAATQADAAPATLRQLFEAYAARLDQRHKGRDTLACVAQTARAVERLWPDWLDRPVGEVTEDDLFAFRKARVAHSVVALKYREEAQALRAAGQRAKAEARDRLADAAERTGTQPSTINRDLRTLRAMLKSVRPEFRVPPGVFFPEDDTRVRWLRPAEELLVLESVRAPFRAMATLAAWTLMRLTEVRTLRWAMVHLEQGIILLPRAKGGPRPVMLSAAAGDLLRAQRAGSGASEWVFPGPTGRPYGRSAVSRAFRRAARGAGLQDFHFHDLRHHGATMALNRGFTAPIVMALGGWKTERMMRRYAAVTDQTLRAAAEAVSGADRSWAPREAAPHGAARA